MGKHEFLWRAVLGLTLAACLLAGCAGGVRQGVTPQGYPYMGRSDAPLVMVEFTDFQSPKCAEYTRETFPQIRERYIETGKVLYIFRNLPLPINNNAFPAAEASLCAADQGRYWAMRDRLFETQAQWAQETDAVAFFKGLAGELGLDQDRFDACMDGHQHADRVDDDALEALEKGAKGVPFFLLEGLPLSGAYPFSDFEELIETALR